MSALTQSGSWKSAHLGFLQMKAFSMKGTRGFWHPSHLSSFSAILHATELRTSSAEHKFTGGNAGLYPLPIVTEYAHFST